MSGYARVTRTPSGAVVVTKVKPYRRQPPKQEEQMSTRDRTRDPLGLGPLSAASDQEAAHLEYAQLKAENARLRAELDECTRSHQRMNADYEQAVDLLEATARDFGADVLAQIKAFLDER